MLYPIYTYTLVSLIGLILGSFLNVVIWRYPVILQRQWQQYARDYLCQQPNTSHTPACHSSTFNLLSPRSQCQHCHKTLYWHDLIPLLSYIRLRGRCRFCQQDITKQYPLIELLMALASISAWYRWGASQQLVLACLFSGYLIVLASIDFNCQLLPDTLTLSLLWIGLLISVNHCFISSPSAILAASMGYLMLWILAYSYQRLRHRVGMGHGDFKLLAAIGAWTGMMPLFHVVCLATLLGLSIHLFVFLRNKVGYHQALPFGPALAISGWIILMYEPVATKLPLQFYA